MTSSQAVSYKQSNEEKLNEENGVVLINGLKKKNLSQTNLLLNLRVVHFKIVKMAAL